MVKMKMLTLYLFPVRSRSVSIEVTDAELMMPESKRLREQRMPAIVQSLRSIFKRNLFSISLGGLFGASCSSASVESASSDVGERLRSGIVFGGVSDVDDDSNAILAEQSGSVLRLLQSSCVKLTRLSIKTYNVVTRWSRKWGGKVDGWILKRLRLTAI